MTEETPDKKHLQETFTVVNDCPMKNACQDIFKEKDEKRALFQQPL